MSAPRTLRICAGVCSLKINDLAVASTQQQAIHCSHLAAGLLQQAH
ncbi:hypothetical protein ACLK1Y_04575 [Escherichia coli]